MYEKGCDAEGFQCRSPSKCFCLKRQVNSLVLSESDKAAGIVKVLRCMFLPAGKEREILSKC
jgi:hypothetical protein